MLKLWMDGPELRISIHFLWYAKVASNMLDPQNLTFGYQKGSKKANNDSS